MYHMLNIYIFFFRVHDKKLAIVTLCTLLNFPVDKIPPLLLPGWPQLLTSVSHVFEGLPRAMEGKLVKVFIINMSTYIV